MARILYDNILSSSLIFKVSQYRGCHRGLLCRIAADGRERYRLVCVPSLNIYLIS